MFLKIKDILYTDNEAGTYRESKTGEKYDFRKQFLYFFYKLSDYGIEHSKKYGLQLNAYSFDFEIQDLCLYTTPYVGYKILNGSEGRPEEVEIETKNSFYICEVIYKDDKRRSQKIKSWRYYKLLLQKLDRLANKINRLC